MSILVDKINSNLGSASGGYPPGNVTDVTISNKSTTDTLTINWTAPNDIIIGDEILSQFSRIEILLKEGSAPKTNRDGIKIYDSKEEIISGGTNNTSICNTGSIVLSDIKTYYIRFFVYSKDNVCNSDINMIYEFIPLFVSNILSENSWETIDRVSEAGEGQDYWNIGDEIIIELSGSLNEPVVLQIWDFNHFDKSDGSGKANIVFGCKNLLNKTYQMNSNDTNSTGWESCKMRTETMKNIYNSIPSPLKPKIKQVNTVTTKGSNSTQLQTSKDYVFIPNHPEVGFTGYESEGYKFPIFSNDTSRSKSKQGGSADNWWLRSPNRSSGNTSFARVGSAGVEYWNTAYYSHGVAFCFCV